MSLSQRFAVWRVRWLLRIGLGSSDSAIACSAPDPSADFSWNRLIGLAAGTSRTDDAGAAASASMARPSEPRTAAGRALLADFTNPDWPAENMAELAEAILAIEAEASAPTRTWTGWDVPEATAPDPVATAPEAFANALTEHSKTRHHPEYGCRTTCAPDILARLPEAPAHAAVASPAPLDVERLARAIDASWADLLAPLGGQSEGLLRSAEKVAAEYARLGQPVAEEPRAD